MRWRIMFVLLFAALLPLALAGFGSWIVFGKLLESKSLEQMETEVKGHALVIDAYLTEQLHLLRLIAESHSLEDFTRPGEIRTMFDDLNRSSDDGFVDLGVIDMDGRHLAYVGPYDLKDRNYIKADWFKEVNLKGEFISDVFMGFRQIPHCIVAVKITEGGRPWILRATINSERFDTLVKTEEAGNAGDAYIVTCWIK